MASSIVNILMATYNGERYVAEQIESIQRQTYQDWRLLVSDDCSNDGTLDVVRSYALKDSRISIVSEGVRHGGAKENFMSLLAKSDAPYAMFCDQDDVWLPGKVEKTLEPMHNLENVFGNSQPLLTFSDMHVVDDKLKIIADSFESLAHYDPERLAFPQLLAQNVAAGCTMLINREAVILARKTPNDARIIMHDWWLMLVVSAFGHIAFLDEPLSNYRQHGDNELGATKYSPSDRATHQDYMEEQFRASIVQAQVFYETFGCDLAPLNRTCIEQFASILQCKSFFSGLYHYCRSRCFKKSVRKLGQLAMVARVAKHNRAFEKRSLERR